MYPIELKEVLLMIDEDHEPMPRWIIDRIIGEITPRCRSPPVASASRLIHGSIFSVTVPAHPGDPLASLSQVTLDRQEHL